jgi:hypothetical protein
MQAAPLRDEARTRTIRARRSPSRMQANPPRTLTQEQKLDEALKDTFPASDAFYVEPEAERPQKRADPAAAS